MNYGHYRNCLEDEVFAATPVELVRMLYRAAIDAVDDAQRCLGQNDIPGRTRAINKCCAIVIELGASLDRSDKSGLGRSLAELYDYALRRLLEAQSRQIEAPLIEVRGLLSTILDGWSKCDPDAAQPPVCPPIAVMENRNYGLQARV